MNTIYLTSMQREKVEGEDLKEGYKGATASEDEGENLGIRNKVEIQNQ